MSIQQNLEHILSRIRAAELRAGRPAGSVRLVAVSKTFPAEDVKACHDAGQRIFGENKVQEGLGKSPPFLRIRNGISLAPSSATKCARPWNISR